jgi:DNA polymerase I
LKTAPTDGRMKLRGLACRRTDTPAFIAEVQLRMLSIIARAQTLAERHARIDDAMALLNNSIRQLECGEVEPKKLLLRRMLTKEVDAYVVTTRTATAARELRDLDVIVHPGERVSYIITDAKSKDPATRISVLEMEPEPDYDREEYIRLLKLAAAEVMEFR